MISSLAGNLQVAVVDVYGRPEGEKVRIIKEL